jgi:hypothetical protein
VWSERRWSETGEGRKVNTNAWRNVFCLDIPRVPFFLGRTFARSRGTPPRVACVRRGVMSFSTAPPGLGRRRRDPPPQRELTAANLAQQRSQPFEARMPAVAPGRDGHRDGLPLGREGAVCGLCGNSGHDAEVCADRPSPALRVSLDLDEDGNPTGFPSTLTEEPSMSSIPDSPSHLFPKPTPAESRAMRAKLEALETKKAEKQAKETEAKLRALDELHRDVTDGGGDGGPDFVESRFDPYVLHPKRTFKPPPTRTQILAKQALELEAALEAKLLADEAAGNARRKPPLPRPDVSVAGSDTVRGIAAWEESKRQLAAEDAETAAREKRAAEREKLELAKAMKLALLRAMEDEDGLGANVASNNKGALAGLKENEGDDEGGAAEEEPDLKNRARELLETKQAANRMPGGGASGAADDLRQPIVTHENPVADDDVAVAMTVAAAVANVVQTGTQPDWRLYEPEGGFQGMLQARKTAERDACLAQEELVHMRREAASQAMALFEERERHAIDLERSDSSARDALASAARLTLDLAATKGEIDALRVRCDAELCEAKQDAEANVEAARMASASVAEESRKVRAALEEVRASAATEAGKANDAIASLRRQLERAERDSRNAHDELTSRLEATEVNLKDARAEIVRADARTTQAVRQTEDAESRAAGAERRATAAETSERKLAAVRRKTGEAAAMRAGLELDVCNATQAAVAAAGEVSYFRQTRREPSSAGRALVKKPKSASFASSFILDPEIAAARTEAMRYAAEQLAFETAAAATAISDAKRVRRKAAELESELAKTEYQNAPLCLKPFRIAARVFVAAGSDFFATAETRVALEQAGYSVSHRPPGADASPGRAQSAEAFVLLDSQVTRQDDGVATELSAAVTIGRRVYVLCDTEHLGQAETKWRALSPHARFIAHAAGAVQAAVDTIAKVTHLGVPDYFLSAMSQHTLQLMASDAKAPDFVGLAGATALRFDPAAFKRKDTNDVFDGNANLVYQTLANALSLNSPLDVLTVKVGGNIDPSVAKNVAQACCGDNSRVLTLTFGGAFVPVGAIRDARRRTKDVSGKTQNVSSKQFHLDLTLFEPGSAAERCDFGLGPCELQALAGCLETCGVTVTSVQLPPWVPARTVRATLVAIGGFETENENENDQSQAERNYPAVNGVPSQFDTGSDTVDLTPPKFAAFGVPGAVALALAMERHQKTDWRIKNLCLNGACLGGEGGDVLAELLSSCAVFSTLTVLSVTNSELGGHGLESVLVNVPNSLKTLDIGGNAGGDRCCPFVVSALKKCTKLKRLGLSRNEIGADGAVRLAPSIRDHACLTEIQLDGNRIGDRGVAAVATAVRATAAPLQVLRLAGNANLTAASAKSLAPAVGGSQTLKVLDLAKAAIGPEGVKSLCVALSDAGGSTCLETLELGGCRLRAEGAKWVGDLLKNCRSLKKLGLARNSLGDKGAFELSERGLDFSLGLVSIDLRHNAIGPEGMKKLRASFEKKCVTVTDVQMDGNKLTETESGTVHEVVSRQNRTRLAVAKKVSVRESLKKGSQSPKPVAAAEKRHVSPDTTTCADASHAGRRPALRAKAVLVGEGAGKVGAHASKKNERDVFVSKETPSKPKTNRETREKPLAEKENVVSRTSTTTSERVDLCEATGTTSDDAEKKEVVPHDGLTTQERTSDAESAADGAADFESGAFPEETDETITQIDSPGEPVFVPPRVPEKNNTLSPGSAKVVDDVVDAAVDASMEMSEEEGELGYGVGGGDAFDAFGTETEIEEPGEEPVTILVAAAVQRAAAGDAMKRSDSSVVRGLVGDAIDKVAGTEVRFTKSDSSVVRGIVTDAIEKVAGTKAVFTKSDSSVVRGIVGDAIDKVTGTETRFTKSDSSVVRGLVTDAVDKIAATETGSPQNATVPPLKKKKSVAFAPDVR